MGYFILLYPHENETNLCNCTKICIFDFCVQRPSCFAPAGRKRNASETIILSMDKEKKHTYNNKGNREEKPRLLSRLEFRLLPIDKNIIRGQAKRYGLTVGEYIRCRALSIAPPPEYHPEEYVYLALLKKTSADLKRLSNIIKTKDELTNHSICDLVKELKQEIERIKTKRYDKHGSE